MSLITPPESGAVPQSSRVDRILVGMACVSLMLAAGAVGWSVSVASARAFPGYRAGQTFAAGSAVQFDGAPATLVMWVDSQCGACTESSAFYQTVTSRPRRTRVVVMGPEPIDRLRGFVKQAGIKPDQIVSTSGDHLEFKGTPTLLLVGRDSVVRNIWYGRRATPSDEGEVLRLLD